MRSESRQGCREASGWRRVCGVLVMGLLVSLALASPAAAEQVRRLQGTFGPAAQPVFGRAGSLAIYQSGANAGDVLVADQGAQEEQQLTVAATAGQFRLCFEGQCTGDLAFNASNASVREALWALSTIGSQELGVSGGPGDATGSKPYLVQFRNKLSRRDVPQLECENGTTPLSGGAGCSVSTLTTGTPAKISRWHADGTAAEFSGLGTNAIEEIPVAGEPAPIPIGPASETQIAIDESSGTPTAGDIYLSDEANQKVQVFGADGTYLGSIGQAGATPFGEIRGVAVDPAGVLYVADFSRQAIYRFLPSANPPKSSDSALWEGKACKPDGHVSNLALGAGPTAGSLFVTGDSKGVAKVAIPSCEVQGTIPSSVNPNNVLAADPAGGHLFLAQAKKVGEYDFSGPGATLASTTISSRFLYGGIAAGGAGLYFAGSSRIDEYGPVVHVPEVETEEATAITPTRATLNGTVNADGEAITACRFEYVSQSQFDTNTHRKGLDGFAGAAGAACEGSVPADHSPHPVSARLGGLVEGERYLYRLTASDECEVGVQCPPGERHPSRTGALEAGVLELRLTHVAETTAAKEVGGATATLTGTVNPDATAVSDCHFAYLTQAAYQAARANEVQSLTLEGAAGGAFTLSFGGETTEPIPFDAQAEAIEADLAELLSIGGPRKFPSARVSGEPGGPYTIEFRGEDLEARNVESLEADASGLTPPGATATVATVREGATGWEGAASVPCEQSGSEIGEGEAPVPVQAKAPNLQSGTLYRFRLVASNGNVSGSASPEGRTFETLHTVETKPASEASGHGATLNGTVNPFGQAVSECYFEYGASAEYGQTAPCAESEAEIGTGSTPVAVHADVSGLGPAGAYHFRLVAKIGAEEPSRGADMFFTTLGPLIEAQWAGAVTSTEAILRARIDPNGSATAYRLIWGPASEPEAHTTAAAEVGADSNHHTVTVPLEGLSPAGSYRYRFTASADCNPAEAAEECEVQGPEQQFRTYAPAEPLTGCPNEALRAGPAATLPDCRAYEIVSPLDKNGGGVAPVDAHRARGMSGQSSENGERLAFGSVSAFAGARSSNFNNQYIASRGANGWSTEAIAPPLETPGVQGSPFGVTSEFFAYSPDLCSAWLRNENEVPLAPGAQAGYSNLYRRDNCGGGAFEALTVAPPTNKVSGGYGPGLAGKFAGASADLSQQFFQTEAALTPEAPLSDSTEKVYDLAGGGLHLVSVLPDGSGDQKESYVGSPLEPTLLAEGYGAMRNAVSSDGSRLFWTSAPVDGFGAVYVRENSDRPESTTKDGEGHCLPEAGRACTLQLSPGAHSLFLTATPDGSKVLLQTKGSLELIDIAAGTRTVVAAGLPEVVSALFVDTGFLGASADLSRIYLVSKEALAVGASAGADNLYAWHEGVIAFIGALSGADVSGFRSPVALSANAHDARVNPDGTRAAFVSGSAALAQASAGYDNADAKSGEADREAYLYDATAGGGAGRLLCVSCNPSGARPLGIQIPIPGGGGEEPPAAALIPIEPNVYHTSNPLSADGSKLFFEAYDPLLPHDTNGTWDVYEWEQAGHGSCREGAADYFAANGGCVDLVSTGTDPQPSEFFDADPTGKNVFIRTTASLDPRDEGAYDVYDAREAGGFALPAAAAQCEGEACQSPPAPPNDPTPASAAFEGAGNVREPTAKPCKKGKVRRHGKCVRKHRKAKHKRHHRRANHNRHHRRANHNRRATR